MPQELHPAQAQRESLRWTILLALNYARPVGASETIVLRTVQDIPIHITSLELRKELDYLAGMGFIELRREDRETWYAKITPSGIDLVEYQTDCPPGIGRPKKYW